MRRSFWDIAYRYGDEREHWDAPRPPRELVQRIDEGLIAGRVLDVGCGTGSELLHLAGRKAAPHFAGEGPDGADEFWGVDRSLPGLVRAARRSQASQGSIRWSAADVTLLPFRDAVIDVVLDRGCLHVLHRRLRAAYAREMARVVVSGGWLLLRGARRSDPDAGYVALERSEIEQLFDRVGFARQSVEPIELEARAGNLAGWAYLFRRSPSRDTSTVLEDRPEKSAESE